MLSLSEDTGQDIGKSRHGPEQSRDHPKNLEGTRGGWFRSVGRRVARLSSALRVAVPFSVSLFAGVSCASDIRSGFLTAERTLSVCWFFCYSTKPLFSCK